MKSSLGSTNRLSSIDNSAASPSVDPFCLMDLASVPTECSETPFLRSLLLLLLQLMLQLHSASQTILQFLISELTSLTVHNNQRTNRRTQVPKKSTFDRTAFYTRQPHSNSVNLECFSNQIHHPQAIESRVDFIGARETCFDLSGSSKETLTKKRGNQRERKAPSSWFQKRTLSRQKVALFYVKERLKRKGD